MARQGDELEALVTEYRRAAASAADGEVVELELRVAAATPAMLCASVAAVEARRAAGDLDADEGAVTQTVVAVMPEAPPPTRGAPRASRRREIDFAGGARVRDEVWRKESLSDNYRGPGWLAALSLETRAQGFSAGTEATLRARVRASYRVRIPAAGGLPFEWRLDVSLVRQLAGAAAAELAGVKAEMFRDAQPAALCAALGLAGEGGESAYRAEIELELVGPPGRADALRAADVRAAAALVLGLVGAERAAAAASGAELVAELAEVAALVRGEAPGAPPTTLKRLLPQAATLTRGAYREVFPPVGWFVAEKTDGVRALARVRGGRAVVVTDSVRRFDARPGARAVDAVVDGEWVAGDDGGGRFHAFDVVALGDARALRGEGFEARSARLADAAAALRAAGVDAVAKDFARLEAGRLREAIEPLLARSAGRADGLVFVEPGRPYAATATLKWKPAEACTIDFAARAPPPGASPVAAPPGAATLFLFVGADAAFAAAAGLRPCRGLAEIWGDDASAAYAPIQFAPPDAPYAYVWHLPAARAAELDGRVVELRVGSGEVADPRLVSWELVRVRADREADARGGRYFGNDARVARDVWLNVLDPFPAAELWDGPARTYFAAAKPGGYRAQTALISFVKTRRIAERARDADWVVDVCAGNGQDLRRYLDARVRHLVAVDADRAALAELVRRRFALAERRGPGDRRAGGVSTGTSVLVLAADAGGPAAVTRDRLAALGLPAAGADALVCNLGVHYLVPDLAGARNFAALCAAAVRPGGAVVLTVLRGEAVHAAFLAAATPPGGTLDFLEGADASRKFSLRRDYSSDVLAPAGQMIGVLLPFSAGEYYPEPLLNCGALAAEMEAAGFRLDVATSVGDAVADFAAVNPPVAAELSKADVAYASLYGELVFTCSARSASSGHTASHPRA